MSRILIVYGTKEGHTATIVERMREALEAQGDAVSTERAGRQLPSIPDDIDGVIVGASVHAGKHQAEIHEFVKKNRTRLETVPSAFFQVCLTAADPSPEAQAATQGLLQEFRTATGWQPETTETFAGMLAWTQYDFFTRSLMRLITRKQEPHPDLHRDYDYTDYDAVRRFAEGFAESLPR
jgi:menaquinone-dependent protoporphyrinogen oxidase